MNGMRLTHILISFAVNRPKSYRLTACRFYIRQAVMLRAGMRPLVKLLSLIVFAARNTGD